MKRPFSTSRGKTRAFPGLDLAFKDAADSALLNAAMTLNEGDVRRAKTLTLRAAAYMNKMLKTVEKEPA